MPHIQKSTLVPSYMLVGKDARCFLSDLYLVTEDEVVDVMELRNYGASVVYVRDREGVPVLASLADNLSLCEGYNKILASYDGEALYLAIAQGEELKLASAYPAADFTTAEYFLFLAIKALQINPEVSSICFATPLTEEQEMSLGRYFHAVEVVQI